MGEEAPKDVVVHLQWLRRQLILWRTNRPVGVSADLGLLFGRDKRLLEILVVGLGHLKPESQVEVLKVVVLLLDFPLARVHDCLKVLFLR